MKIERVSFVEAEVGLLADRIGHTISYTGGHRVQRDNVGELLAANAAAAAFYAQALRSNRALSARRY